MLQTFLDILYDNFLLIFIALVFVVFTFGMTFVKFLMDRIQTKVLYLRKNDAIWYKATITGKGNIVFMVNKEKYTVVKDSDPYIIKMGRSYITLYFVKEGEKNTCDLRADRGKRFKNVAELETSLTELIDSEITRQSVKGLSEGIEIPLTYKVGLIAIGMAILYVLQLIVDKVG